LRRKVDSGLSICLYRDFPRKLNSKKQSAVVKTMADKRAKMRKRFAGKICVD